MGYTSRNTRRKWFTTLIQKFSKIKISNRTRKCVSVGSFSQGKGKELSSAKSNSLKTEKEIRGPTLPENRPYFHRNSNKRYRKTNNFKNWQNLWLYKSECLLRRTKLCDRSRSNRRKNRKIPVNNTNIFIAPR